MTKPLYFYNGTTFELVGPTTPQSPIAYQTSAPTAPATGDIWIDSDGDVDTYNRQLTRYYFVATAGQTTITGVDANGLTLAYVAGSETVYVNGALQVRGQDYTATNGTSVVMSSGLAVNDVVEIFAYTAFTVANAYTKSETDSVAAAAPGLRLVVPTSVAVGSGSGSVGSSGAVTFSGASSVSLNGCFTSGYDNYKIILEGTRSTNNAIYMRYRASGTDNTTADYGNAYIRNTGGTPAVSVSASNIGYLDFLGTTDSQSYFLDLSVNEPFTANNTLSIATIINGLYATVQVVGTHWARKPDTTSYDGLTFYTSTGTMTGTIRVYGLKN